METPRLYELLGEEYAARRTAEENARLIEEDYNKAIQMTVKLIESLKDESVKLEDLETDENGWRVKRAD